MKSDYERIWGSLNRWPAGPGHLLDLVEHWRGKALVAVSRPPDPFQLNVQLPLPNVKAELGGYEYTILFPEPLRPKLLERCDLILATRRAAAHQALSHLTGQLADGIGLDVLRHMANQALANLERELLAAGAKPLAEIALDVFGLRGTKFKPHDLLWTGPLLEGSKHPVKDHKKLLN